MRGLAAISSGALAVLLLAPWFGAERIDLLAGLRDFGGESVDARILSLRLPRILLGFFAGGSLAITGCVFQTLLRNSLATPYTLGVSFAGTLGAFLALSFSSLSGSFGPLRTVELFAFVFAAGDVLLLDRLARRGQRLDTHELLLAGVTLNFFCGAAILLLRFLTDPLRLRAMDHWMMGSLQIGSVRELAPLPLLLLPGLWILLRQARVLDQLAFGEQLAATRGVDVGKSQRLLLVAGSMVTAAVVALTGPIGFVGLLAPHAARRLVGVMHLPLLPAAFLTGGGFLVLADTAARSLGLLGRGAELPVGVLTALVGAPLFLWLLLRSR
ncbi:MAG TPA: iron ABC transporter permease [Candidatus Krumholzibacteria bacterium]|jgi:iron complex transport system permease protein